MSNPDDALNAEEVLRLARGNLGSRLHHLSRRTETFTAWQITLMGHLLDEFARKSRNRRQGNEQ